MQLGHCVGAVALAVAFSLIAPPAAADGLVGTEWRPLTIGARAADPEVAQSLRFEPDDRAVGEAGCNAFNGVVRVDETTLRIGPLATTRRLCPPSVMALEQALLGALAIADGFARDDDRLELQDVNGNVVAVFELYDGR